MSEEIILVVDDNPLIADLIGKDLLPAMGFKTVVAYSGQEALDIFRSTNISLVVLDLQLPDMGGLQILRKLERMGHNVPAILVTGHGSEKIAVESFRLGVYDYLTKPIDTEHLRQSIGRALSTTRLRAEKVKLTQQLKEQLTWQATLSKVGRSVTSSLNLDDVLIRIVEAGIFLSGADDGFVALLDENNEQLYVRAAKNIDENKIKTIRLPIQDSLIGQAFAEGRAVRLTSNSSNGSPIKVSTGFLAHSVLHIPILSKGKGLGVLSMVNHKRERPFTRNDEQLLTSLADYAAIAIENANLYQQVQDELAERIRVEEALRESEERYALAVRGANDGLWDWNLKSHKIYFSPRWKEMFGYGENEIGDLPEDWFSLVHPDDLERLKIEIRTHLNKKTALIQNEHRMLHQDGAYRWVLCRGIAVWDASGTAIRIAGSLTDITDRKIAEAKLLHDAFHDHLTGLPNRALFLDHLRMAIDRSKRHKDYKFAVLFLDLDRFKDINDSHGHITGDHLLVAVGQKLAARMRSTDTVARFGGDEFVILLEDFDQVESVKKIARWVLSEISTPYHIRNLELYTSASIGIVLGDGGYTRPEDVLRDADIAMYKAKANGKARFEIFTPVMRSKLVERLKLENDLRQAVKADQLRVHYQVIVSGFEALVRWLHPSRGLIHPKDFIYIAEETGLVISIDRWVLKKAGQQLKTWHREIPITQKLTMSVNFSGKQFSQPDIIDFLRSALEEIKLDPNFLKLEITESAIMEHNALTSDLFGEIQALGVQIQIDDFGIGYTSLSYLSSFPINALKIDQSFVNTMIEDNNNMKIIQAIVTLSNRLGVRVIAEGVETKKQLMRLKDLGCEYGQGYYLSTPLEGEKIAQLLIESEKGVILEPFTKQFSFDQLDSFNSGR